MFAVVKIAGKQFIAQVGKKIKIDAKIEAKDKKIKLSEILLVADEKSLKVGKPTVSGASVDAEIVSSELDKKVLIVKHHSKKRYRRTKGHRQDKTIIEIKKINE